MSVLIPVESYSDLEIADKIRLGETALYEIIIRKYNPVLYKIGRSYGFDHHTTEDIMQETFVKAYFNLESFKGLASLKTWISKIMINNCYHFSQKFSNKMEKSGIPHNNNINPVFSTPASVENSYLNKELGNIIESALFSLAEEYRMVFTLREMNSFNVSETAKILDISESNVKARLSRAKNMLRKKIQEMYSPAELFSFNLIYCDKMVERVMTAIRTKQG
jgi:RNA polymerase sigma-70 factor (ECF subfamily)